MYLYIFLTILVLAITAYYWLYLRDDGGYPEDRIVLNNIKKPQTFQLPKKNSQKVKKEGLPMKVLFYTQTGTAEDYATRFGEDAGNFGFASDVVDVEAVADNPEELSNERLIIIFASTYGEGDPPDNCVEFHNWLMDSDRESTTFSNTKFAILGLGNKTYDKFNEVGKILDKRFEELGGKRIFDLGCCDDDDNSENDFLIWKKKFSQIVCAEFGLPPPGDLTLVDLKCKHKIVTYDKVPEELKNPSDIDKINRWRTPANNNPTVVDRNVPFLAKIVKIKELHGSESDRSCLHIEVSTHGKILHYQTGSHIGIYPENDTDVVNELASLLKVNLNDIVSLHMKDSPSSRPIVGPCTIKALFQQYFDITYHAKKQLLRVLAQYASDPTEKETLHTLATDDPSRQQQYESFIVKDQRSIVDVLIAFPSINVPLDHLFEVLPKMQPRMYSISSSPNVHKDTVHITAVLTEWVSPIGKKIKGVATNWFAAKKSLLDAGEAVHVPSFIRKSNFVLPINLTHPIMMVGPGTGLAPFRGFLQEIKYRWSLEYAKNLKKPETILFFGCRAKYDYIYEDELVGYEADGTVTSLQVAFSRLGQEKVYVQHLMQKEEMRKKIWNLVTAKGYIYICGDAHAMARDVSKTLISIFEEEGKMNPKDAEKYLDRLSTQGRFLQDVWS